jgi:RNA polymerase sigma-70 factor (ECF subfamily)
MKDGTDPLALAELLDERRHLLDVACWMLGSGSESEKVVDETYGRWYALSDVARRHIRAPRSWLAKVAGSLCLDRLAPQGWAEDLAVVVEEEAGARQAGAARSSDTVEQQVSEVLRDALDSLSAAEQEAFAFNDVIGARRGLQPLRPRAGAAQHDEVVRTVRAACLTQDAELLASVVASDAAAFFDGGGKVRSLVRPVYGGEEVAYHLLTLMGRRAGTTLDTHSVNGRTGMVARYHHQVAAVISFGIADHRVTQVFVTLNPDKLRSWNKPTSRP